MKARWRWVAAPAGLVLVLLLVAYVALLHISGNRLAAARRALAEAGFPMTPGALIPAAVPAESNAAPLYVEALAQLKVAFPPCGAVIDGLPIRELPLAAPEDRARAAACLAHPAAQRALALVRAAAARPFCRTYTDYTVDLRMQFPYIWGSLNLCCLTVQQALLEAQTGQPREAYRTVQAAFRLADAQRDEPVFICFLVRERQVGIIFKPLQTLCAETPPTDAEVAALLTTLEPLTDRTVSVRVLHGDRLLFAEPAFAALAEKGEVSDLLVEKPKVSDLRGADLNALPTRLLASRPGRFLLRPWLRADQTAYLRCMLCVTQAGAKPYYQAMHDTDALVGQIPRVFVLTRMFVPALACGASRQARLEAQIAVTRVGLAVLCHRRRHGACPARLADLEPTLLAAIPVDPFTGGPLNYRVTPSGGCVIYSIGTNGKDDGGDDTPNEWRPPLDIVWRGE